jgi:hypothetical protein
MDILCFLLAFCFGGLLILWLSDNGIDVDDEEGL